MTYNRNIPQPTDKLSKSQVDLLNNFGQLAVSFGIDHYTYDNQTQYNGMHYKSSYVEQESDPNPPLTVDDVYTKVVNGLGELFYQRGGSSPSVPVQITRGNPFPYANNYTPQSGGGPVGTDFDAGATFLAGGILIQYGTVNTNQLTVKYPLTFSSSPYMIQLTLNGTQSAGARIALSVINESSTTSFSYFLTTVNTSANYVNWLAIGPG